MMTLAFPGQTSSHREAVSIRTFIDAMTDRKLASTTREREPKSLDEAVKIAMRMEGYRKAEVDHEERIDRRSCRANAITDGESKLEIVLQRLERMKRSLELSRPTSIPYSSTSGWAAHPKVHPLVNGPNTGTSGSRPPRSSRGGRRHPLRSFECQATDHFARTCTL